MTAKKMVLVMPMVLLPCLAFGGIVSYSTTGVVTGLGASFITYSGVSATVQVFAGPTSHPFGALRITCTSGTCDLTGTKLTVTVAQIRPGPGMGSITATLTGTVTPSGGTFTLAWNTGFSIPPISYGGSTRSATCRPGFTPCSVPLQNFMYQHFVPEPSAALLLGLGTLGLMGLTTATRKLISI